MFTDDNGIVRFEDDDEIAPLHVGLNTALTSVSEAIDDTNEHVLNHTHSEIVDGDFKFQLSEEGGSYINRAEFLTQNQRSGIYISGETSDIVRLEAKGGNRGNHNAIDMRPDGSIWVRA